MKLSTATRYGLRALSDLCFSAPVPDARPVSVSDIAARQGIPLNFLEQLFARLRRGGLVKSVRGAQGGYLLARPASEISISEVMQALGEPISFGDCQTGEGCLNAPTCPTFRLWRRVKGSVDGILAETTLADILEEKLSLSESGDPDPEREEARDRAWERQNDTGA